MLPESIEIQIYRQEKFIGVSEQHFCCRRLEVVPRRRNVAFVVEIERQPGDLLGRE